MKHFFFKYQKNNKGINIWRSKHTSDIDLSIYYGAWKIEDYPNNIGEINRSSRLRELQIRRFFELKEEKEPVYFWVFHHEDIYCFQAVDLNVYNGPAEYIKFSGGATKTIESLPKSIKAVHRKTLKKIEQPEFFSNINSNQAYNRMTLTELKGVAQEYANAIVSNKKIEIDLKNFYKYLSPTQFETLVFLIFTNGKSLCSSFRGSTLKDYDLKVIINEQFNGIEKGAYWFQVKLKGVEMSTRDSYLIHIGKTNLENKIIGIDWITDRIRERKDILRWLNECIFNYELIDAKINGV